MSSLVHVDGSVLEGGGAVLRIASAFSVLTQKPVRIYNIRAKRSQPGLRTQHLRGLEALTKLCQGRLEGAKLGSPEIFFYPGEISEHELLIKIETAGSVGLVLQSLLIDSLKIKEKLVLNIEGGSTFSKWAPPLQYIQFVLLPLLRRMGHNVEINILRHGFYPVGGAKVQVIIHPCEKLNPLNISEIGNIEKITGISIASSHLKKPKVAERQARAVEAMLKERGYDYDIKTRYADSRCPGSGVVLIAKTEKGCILGSDGLGERGKPAEVVGEEAVDTLLRNIDSAPTVDEHLSDQILPYMALCKEKSTIVAPVLTMHAETNMFVIKQFLPVEFNMERQGPNVKIECLP